MGDKKGVSRKSKSSEKKRHLLRPLPGIEEDVSEYLLPGEHVVYQANEFFFTDKRIIKHRHNWFARSFHYFYSSFEDLDYRFLESIKAKNVINLRLIFWGLFVLLLGPIALVIGNIPGLRWLGIFLMESLVDGLGLGGLLIIGFVLIVAAVLLRDRIIEFKGIGGTILRTSHLHDDELVKVRELQHIRWRKIGMDK